MNSSAYKELLDKSEIGEDFTAADRDVIESALRLALRATEPDMVMVPREPTQKVIDAIAINMPGGAADGIKELRHYAREAFDDLIAAAQEDQP